eukprot:11193747-Lingulodinium_polyedra.AAC.1
MIVALAFSRFRSRNFVLLTLIRRYAGLSLARAIRTCLRWIPSEFNSSDEGSRLFEDGPHAGK